MSDIHTLLELESAGERLACLREAVERNAESIRDVAPSEEVNNHVHTHYSFSPYSPARAAFMARHSGLQAVGSVDHDSLGAAEELCEASAILGIGSTVGVELRASFADTPFSRKRLNNPDSLGVGYVVIHGVPRRGYERIRRYLRPIQVERDRRNREQTRRLNAILSQAGIDEIVYEDDVLPLSWSERGGTVTERHILYALARRLEQTYGRGPGLISTVEQELGVQVGERPRRYLSDSTNPHFLYDLLAVFKGSFVQRFFVQPNETECRPIGEITDIARDAGAIPAYSYLGDVGDSPTGDKQAQAFEDAYLDELIPALPSLGFQSITYMPPRNTAAQLRRVQRLAAESNLLEISGVDINSSRQVFTCPEVMEPEFRHLTTTTWALIAHEKLSAHDERYGLFNRENPFALRPLRERVELYGGIARRSDPHEPDSMLDSAPELSG